MCSSRRARLTLLSMRRAGLVSLRPPPRSHSGGFMLRCLVSALSGLAFVALFVPTSASANTLTQNTSWTINRTGATQKYRVVAYGDSIYAGYTGSLSSVAKRAGPLVDGEYLGKTWNANIEVIRRTKSGAKADDIYNNKIVGE